MCELHRLRLGCNIDVFVATDALSLSGRDYWNMNEPLGGGGWGLGPNNMSVRRWREVWRARTGFPEYQIRAMPL